MKKLIAPVLLFIALVTVVSCRQDKVKQDDSPVSILVTIDEKSYFISLADKLRDELGIEVEFIHENSSDRTNQIRVDLANGNSQADIIFTNARVPDDMIKGSCVDLLSYSNIASLYTYGRIKAFSSDDGGLYQVPVSARLLGIMYNETLMEENGWEPPRNFDEMLLLKQKCDKLGIRFSTSSFRLSGHGVMFLTCIMGADWLSTIEGTEWMNGFLRGEYDAELFKEKSAYFRKWIDNGLFGSSFPDDSQTEQMFATTRSLFCLDINNHLCGYDGPQVDKNGKPSGKMLHDRFRTMPWISENGTNNCFAVNYSMWVMLSKSLLDPEKSDKLAKAKRILAYVLNPENMDYMSFVSPDSYIPVNGFDITEDKLYSKYADEIQEGFLQPLYYSYFDVNSIVRAGVKIGSYAITRSVPENRLDIIADKCRYKLDPSVSFDDIFSELEASMDYSKAAVLGHIEERLDFEQTAKLVAICGAMALQDEIDKNGRTDSVLVSMVPYVSERKNLEPWSTAIVMNSELYPGTLYENYQYAVLPPRGLQVEAVRMKGYAIKRVVENGFAQFSREYPPCPVMCVTKGDIELQDNEEYLVSVFPGTFDGVEGVETDVMEEKGRVATGLHLFFDTNPSVNGNNIVW